MGFERAMEEKLYLPHTCILLKYNVNCPTMILLGERKHVKFQYFDIFMLVQSTLNAYWRSMFTD